MQKSLFISLITAPSTSLFTGDLIPMLARKKHLLFGLALLLTIGAQAFPVMAQSAEDCAPMTLDSGASACGTPSTNTSTDPLSPDDHRAIESARTRAIDPPIESDHLGNAILPAVVGTFMEGAPAGIAHGLIEYGASELYDSWKHPSTTLPQDLPHTEGLQGAEGNSSGF